MRGSENKRFRGRFFSFSAGDWIALALYIAVHAALLWLHEPWRDEAEAWVIARDYSFGQLLAHLSSEGQPLLWFLVILPLAKLGLPFGALGVVNLALCLFTAYLFLRVSPFQGPFRWIVLASSIFTYYQPVIARNYTLVLLLVVCLIGIWEEREDRPVAYAGVTALLLQTHLLVCGVAIGCMADMALHAAAGRRRRFAFAQGFILCLASLAALVGELYQAPGKAFAPTVHAADILANPRLYSWRSGWETMLSSLCRFEKPGWNVLLAVLIIVLLAVLSILTVWSCAEYGEFLRGAGWLAAVWGGVLAYSLIIVYVRPANHAQLSVCFLMILLFAVCTARPVPLRSGFLSCLWNVKLLFFVLLFLGFPRLAEAVRADAAGSFSRGEDMARYIAGELPGDSVILVRDDYCIPSVSAHIPPEEGITFWNIASDTPYVSYEWGYPYPLVSSASSFRESFAGRPCYYLTSFAYDLVSATDSMELVHAEDGYAVTDERFYLYRFPE